MRFIPYTRKANPGTLPTTERHSPSTSSISEKRTRKDSITSPTDPSKPLAARTASARIQEPSDPIRNPSQVKRGSSTYTKRNGTTSSRPGLQRRRTTAHTRYVEMLLDLDKVPRSHNLLASFFTWILLAGYIVFPATFNSIQNDKNLDKQTNNRLEAHALTTVRNAPLLYIAAFACGIGVLGCIWLWWKHRRNYVWVINRVFLPSLMNSIAGLISTLVNVYSAQKGQYSVTAKVTVIVTGVCSVVTAALFLLYNMVMLKLVKKKHEKETKSLERSLSFSEGIQEEAQVGIVVTGGGKKGKKKSKAMEAVGADAGRIV